MMLYARSFAKKYFIISTIFIEIKMNIVNDKFYKN